MKINILPIKSPLHQLNEINKETEELLGEIKSYGEFTFQLTNIEDFYNADLSLILIQSGGSEGEFLKIFNLLKPPFYLLTYGSNNSLAASIEILSFLRKKSLEAEIFHGRASYIAKCLKDLIKPHATCDNLGVIGKPSDWLIASDVDYQVAKQRYNINLVDIPLQEVEKLYEKADPKKFTKELFVGFDPKELTKAKKIYLALEAIVHKYKLKGLTIRCFDLLKSLKTTSCLALATFNALGIVGTCEGDIPAMISMYIVKKATGKSSFQANPARIDVVKRTAIFAHCTLPLDMCTSYRFDTHFESGIGVGIKGELKLVEVTIFKMAGNLLDFQILKGRIVQNLNRNDLCRSQIEIQFDEDISYFLNNPYGNHHLIVYGNVKEEIKRYISKR